MWSDKYSFNQSCNRFCNLESKCIYVRNDKLYYNFNTLYYNCTDKSNCSCNCHCYGLVYIIVINRTCYYQCYLNYKYYFVV